MARLQLSGGWRRVLGLGCLLLMQTGTALAVPDYLLLDDLLITHVRNGFVDYNGLALDPRLGEFVAQLGSTSPDELGTPEERKAFYINAYNAIVLQGVLDGQSAESFFRRNRFFKKMRVPVLGEELSLEDIEHRRLRPMGDARIHFAIVCASLSCPRLSNRAYLPESLDLQLDEAAERFLNDPTRNRFDAKLKVAFVSRIFDWFEEDFVASAGSVQPYMARFVLDQASARLLRSDSFDLRFEPYDWGLNGSFDR